MSANTRPVERLSIVREQPPYLAICGGGVSRRCEQCGHVRLAVCGPIHDAHYCVREGAVTLVCWT